MRPTRRATLLIIGIAAISASLLMAPFCGFMFRCGCSWLWTTADSYCNIHGAHPPHCPWCSHGTVGSYLPWTGFIIAQSLVGIFTLRFSGKLVLAAILTLLTFAPIGLLMGFLTLKFVNYPHFIFN